MAVNNLSGLPTPTINWNAPDVALEFKNFKELCELYFNGPLVSLKEKQHLAYLMIWVGQEGRDIHRSWGLPADSTLKVTLDRFEQYVKPKCNHRVARYKLRFLKQENDEPIDSFVKRIKLLITECKFDDPEDQTIDALIFGLRSRRIQSKLLQEENLTLDRAVDISRMLEATSKQVDLIHASSVPEVVDNETTNINTMTSKPTPKCGNCGKNHPKSGRCPAKGSECLSCGKKNHWATVCRSSGARPKTPHAKTVGVQALKTHSDDSDDDTLVFNTLSIHTVETAEGPSQAVITLPISLGDKTLNLPCKIDTGAEGNVIPETMYTQLKMAGHTLTKSNTTITAYGGHRVPHIGSCNLNISHGNHQHSRNFHVVQTGGPVILGLPTCNALELVTLNADIQIGQSEFADSQPIQTLKDLKGDPKAKQLVLTKYNDCFIGIGCFEGKHHITIDPNAQPVVHPPRRVPVALREPLRDELNRLEEKGIIAKVDRPTDWVNSIVCVTKPNGKIRLCLDPKDLNKAIKRPHYYTPTLEDVLPKLSGAKYFSILDARCGYWNIQLDDESSYLTTFNTPFGRHRFLRLPFGLCDAQDAFQQKIDQTFGDIPGTAGIADDLIIFGFREDGKDHDASLRAVLECARKTGTRFNEEKMIIRARRIPFFGNIIGASGMEPDPEKVAAIAAMKSPSDLKQLQTFLGMANYLSRFTPRLASLSAPLRDLCKKDSEYIWGPEHEKAFNNIKTEISSATQLQFYDEKKPLVLQVDASLQGLGAVLLQDNGPVAFASKSLSETETRYSNIERELLAVVFGLERFHHYVFGRHVTIESDHKPLEAIVRKNLNNAPPRLARMLLRTQKYNYTLRYTPGRDIPLADALSRNNPCKAGEIPGLNITVHDIELNASPLRLTQIREETAKDTELVSLRDMILDGWPDSRSDCPTQLHGYWNYRDEMAIENGIILKGRRMVIPHTLRQALLDQLHYAHQGNEKCKLRARGSVFWHNINKDIDNMVSSCASCQTHQAVKQREPLHPHDVPPRAWHTLASDLFYSKPHDYLLVSDMYSKFPIVRKLHSTTSHAVISHLKGIFAEHGIPENLVTDNGPQYASGEFRNFAKQYGFTHTTTSPHYPQSNGFIERSVQTIKNLLEKTHESGADENLALLCLRTTPIDSNTPSPCEMLNQRQYRSNLPTMPSRADSDITEALHKRQDKQKQQYDRKSRTSAPLFPDDNIRVLVHPNTKLWEPGRVVRSEEKPRSYLVDTANGRYRRSSHHIRSTKEKFTKNTPTEDDSDEQNVPHELANEEIPQSPTPLRRSTRVPRAPDRLIEL